MPDDNTSSRLKRRTVLKGMGATAALGTTGYGVLANRHKGAVSGVGYDPLTNIVSGEISGRVVRDGDQLNGSLRVAGFQIPMNKLELVPQSQSSADKFRARLTEKKFKKEREPLDIIFWDDPDPAGLSGLISRPSPEFGDLGFYLRDAGSFNAKQAIKNEQPRQKWKQHPKPFSVPSEGLPTSSSPKAFQKFVEKNQGGRS